MTDGVERKVTETERLEHLENAVEMVIVKLRQSAVYAREAAEDLEEELDAYYRGRARAFAVAADLLESSVGIP